MSLNVGWLGYLWPQPPKCGRWKAAVAWRTGQSGAPPDTVRCASHVIRPLGFDRWSSDWWASGLSGGAPDRSCRLSGAPPALALTLARTVAHLMRLQSTVAREVAVAPLAHQTVRCAPDTIR
jgi:hypothetical protein